MTGELTVLTESLSLSSLRSLSPVSQFEKHIPLKLVVEYKFVIADEFLVGKLE